MERNARIRTVDGKFGRRPIRKNFDSLQHGNPVRDEMRHDRKIRSGSGEALFFSDSRHDVDDVAHPVRDYESVSILVRVCRISSERVAFQSEPVFSDGNAVP